jgi:hypothetical protein
MRSPRRLTARAKLAAREHDFLTKISPIALCKRGMLVSTPDFLGISGAAGAASPGGGKVFRICRGGILSARPPSGNDPKPDPRDRSKAKKCLISA